MGSYTVITETKNRLGYQDIYYRAVLVDSCGNRFCEGRQWYANEEDAILDGKDLLKSIKERPTTFNTEIFMDSKSHLKYLKEELITVLIYLLLCMISWLISPIVFIVILLLGVCFIALFLNVMKGNIDTYIYYEGDLYRFLPEKGDKTLLGCYLAGLSTTGLLKGDDVARGVGKYLLDNGAFSRYLDKLSKIEDVTSIKQIGKFYKIKYMVRGRNKTVYIRDGYNNYEDLINCFKELYNSSSEYKEL